MVLRLFELLLVGMFISRCIRDVRGTSKLHRSSLINSLPEFVVGEEIARRNRNLTSASVSALARVIIERRIQSVPGLWRIN
ncbi:unnamed protein product [Heterotrigona itama]|uniref:Secreted protein n=1 Tax=Heterotrigona itama TaxID=395501 RepID=A0A6V7H8A3_9HYME|nr:unnamed protein product [Heterotrigona itama]